MKITTTTHTTVDIHASWPRLDAFKAALPNMKVAYVDPDDGGEEGFTFIGEVPENFTNIVQNIVDKHPCTDRF